MRTSAVFLCLLALAALAAAQQPEEAWEDTWEEAAQPRPGAARGSQALLSSNEGRGRLKLMKKRRTGRPAAPRRSQQEIIRDANAVNSVEDVKRHSRWEIGRQTVESIEFWVMEVPAERARRAQQVENIFDGVVDAHGASEPKDAALRAQLVNFCKAVLQGIPPVLIAAVEFVELYGLRQEGVWRLAGDRQARDALYSKFANNGYVRLPTSSLATNVATATSLANKYLMEHPLVGPQTAAALVAAGNNDQVVKSIIGGLTGENARIFKYMVGHWRRVAAQAAENKMTPKNIAICVFSLIAAPPTVQQMKAMPRAQLKKAATAFMVPTEMIIADPHVKFSGVDHPKDIQSLLEEPTETEGGEPDDEDGEDSTKSDSAPQPTPQPTQRPTHGVSKEAIAQCKAQAKLIKQDSAYKNAGGRRLLGGGSRRQISLKEAAAMVLQGKIHEREAKDKYLKCCTASAACTAHVKDKIAENPPKLIEEEMQALSLVAERNDGPTSRRLLGRGFNAVRGVLKGKSITNTAASISKLAKAEVGNHGVFGKLKKVAGKVVKMKEQCMEDWRKKNTYTFRHPGMQFC